MLSPFAFHWIRQIGGLRSIMFGLDLTLSSASQLLQLNMLLFLLTISWPCQRYSTSEAIFLFTWNHHEADACCNRVSSDNLFKLTCFPHASTSTSI
jgi:hypothetical protein